MKIQRINAIFKKQFTDKGSLRSVMFQSLFYPLFVLLFSLSNDSDAKFHIVAAMTPMFIGSTPMLTVNNIVREDRSSGALRALMLASVKPLEYMTAIGMFMLITASAASLIIGIVGGLTGSKLFYFFAATAVGCLLTVMLACVFSLRKNSNTNAVMLINVVSVINGLIPTLELFYPSINTVTRFWYTQQVKTVITSLYTESFNDLIFSFAVIAANLAIFVAIFVIVYRKNRIFSQQ